MMRVAIQGWRRPTYRPPAPGRRISVISGNFEPRRLPTDFPQLRQAQLIYAREFGDDTGGRCGWLSRRPAPVRSSTWPVGDYQLQDCAKAVALRPWARTAPAHRREVLARRYAYRNILGVVLGV